MPGSLWVDVFGFRCVVTRVVLQAVWYRWLDNETDGAARLCEFRRLFRAVPG